MTVLSDKDIKVKIANNGLVQDGETSRVGPACYELTMGSIYYDLTEGDRRIDATSYDTILVKPGHRVVLITKELINICQVP